MNTYLNLNNFYKIEENEKKLQINFHNWNTPKPFVWTADSKTEYQKTLLNLTNAIKNNTNWFLLNIE